MITFKFKIFIVLFASIILLTGCQTDKKVVEIDDSIIQPRFELQEWTPLNDSVEVFVWPYENDFGQGNLFIFKFASDSFDLQIKHSQTNPQTVSQWAEGLDGERLVINGAYFLEDDSPAGYLKVAGQRIGELIFDQDKSGALIYKNSELQLRDLAVEPLTENDDSDYVLQSYPFLIKNSRLDIKEDSGLLARRTAMGTDDDGDVYIVISEFSNLSLFELMTELKATKIKFENVLNLDGGPSTGLYYSTENEESFLIDSLATVPNVIVFDFDRGE